MFFFITPLCLGWLLGTVLQLQQALLWPVNIYQALCVLGLLCVVGLAAHSHPAMSFNDASPMADGDTQRRRHMRTLAWCGLSAALAFGQTGWRASHFQTSALNPALEGRPLWLEGVVAAMPQRHDDSLRFVFEVTRASDASGAPVQVPPKVMLGWYGARVGGDAALRPPPPVRAGDRWRLPVRLKAPHGHLNPHGFDLELWLWEQGLQASGYVRNARGDAAPIAWGATASHPIERWRQHMRERVWQQVDAPRSAGVIAALLVGDQASIERADWEVFRITGVAHLMAISGLHITGLAWLVTAWVAWAWRRSDVLFPQRPWSVWMPAPQAGQLAGCAVALMYGLFSGWGLPAQRTVWMLCWTVALRSHGHRWPWPQVWLWVCAWVVAIDPWALLQAGFWLSFVAVGVLFASNPETPVRHTSYTQRAMAPLLRMLREQWLMSVCLAPLTLLLFNQVSLVGLLANLLAVPWVTLGVTPLCLLGSLWPSAWSLAAWALDVLMLGLGHAATASWAQWSAPSVPVWVNVSALLGMALWVVRLPWWLRCLSGPMLGVMLTWQVPRPPSGEFELVSADMGQGHAVLVRTATHALLYDTGPRYSAETDAGQRVLVPLLRALGERLDRIVISHQDSDHSGGAEAVMAMQMQADVWTSIADHHPLRAKHTMHTCVAGQRWQWDQVEFSVLHPLAEDYARARSPNANSCVLRVQSTSGQVALLVGDIEAAQEKELLQRQAPLRATWLLVPHHGSATSSTTEFLQAVQPQIAVVQAGYRNRYGHPRADVMARYDALQALVVQTTRCGASTWQSDRPIMVHCAREEQQRYWHHRLP